MLGFYQPQLKSCTLSFQQIKLFKVAKSCLKESRVILLFAKKSVYVARLTGPWQTCFAEVTEPPVMARLSHNCIQSEVSTHSICNNLICCKTVLNEDGKMRNIVIQLVF